MLLFNLCKFHSIAKEHLERNIKGKKEETRYKIIDFFNKLYNSVSVIKIKDLLKKYIQNLTNLESNYKNKFISIINSYKAANLSTNVKISFRNSIKDKSFNRDRSDSEHIPLNFIKNRLESINKEKRSLDIKENKGYFRRSNKEVNKFTGSFKIKPQITLELADKEESQGNMDVISENDIWINSEIKNGKLVEFESIICMGNCHLCSFIRKILDDLFKREIMFNNYEKYLLNNFTETFILNKNLNYKLQFSNYLDHTEGTSRVRNRFKIKVDKILNSEIQNKKKSKTERNIINKEENQNELENIFGFYKRESISNNLNDFFNLGQLFQIDYISDCIDKKDTYQYSCNCLLLKGFNYINSVLILGEIQLNQKLMNIFN